MTDQLEHRTDDLAAERAATCGWCGAPIPAAAAGAYVIRGGDHEVPACSPDCLAELVADVTGAV